MRTLFTIAAHAAVPALEIALHGVGPLAILSAFMAAILVSILLLSPALALERNFVAMVGVWLAAAATVLLWVGCVVLLDSRGIRLYRSASAIAAPESRAGIAPPEFE